MDVRIGLKADEGAARNWQRHEYSERGRRRMFMAPVQATGIRSGHAGTVYIHVEKYDRTEDGASEKTEENGVDCPVRSRAILEQTICICGSMAP